VIAWVLLALALAATGSFWHMSRSGLAQETENRFSLGIDQARSTVLDRFDRYEDALLACRGLFAVDNWVARSEWETFVRRTLDDNRYPGLRGVTYISHVPRSRLRRFRNHVRADGRPHFRVFPETRARDYMVATYVDPEGPKDLAGYDFGSDARGRQPLETALGTAEAIVGGPLVYGADSSKTVDAALYLPVYRKGGAIDTPEARRKSNVGWVAAIVDLEDLFADLNAGELNHIRLTVYDGPTAAPDRILYAGPAWPSRRSEPGFWGSLPGVATVRDLWDGRGLGTSPLRETIPVNFGRGEWLLAFTADPVELAQGNRTQPWVALLVGLFASFLIFNTLWSMSNSLTRAETLADTVSTSLERREVEARKLSLVASRTHNGVFLTGADRRIEWVNDALARMTGYSLADVRGRRAHDIFFGPDTNAETVGTIVKHLDHNEGCTSELLCYRKSGQTFWAAVENQPIFDDDGNIQGTMGILSDITERRESQDALRDSEERFRSLIEGGSDIITSLDREGFIGYVSPSVTKVLGYDPTEQMGKCILDFLHEEDQARFRNYLACAVENPGVAPAIRFRMHHQDGTWRHLEAVANSVSAGDGGPMVFLNSRDITERTRAESRVK